MTRQSKALTEPNESWIAAQVESPEYSGKSDAVKDLICTARAEEQKLEMIRAGLIESEQSGFLTPNRETMRKAFKAHKTT